MPIVPYGEQPSLARPDQFGSSAQPYRDTPFQTPQPRRALPEKRLKTPMLQGEASELTSNNSSPMVQPQPAQPEPQQFTPPAEVQKIENNSVLPPTTKELIFQQVRRIVSQHPDKIAVTFDPDNPHALMTARTRFLGFEIQITEQQSEGQTTESIDLLGENVTPPNQPRYRLDISHGEEVEARFDKVKDVLTHTDLDKGELLEKYLRNNYSESLGDKVSLLNDTWAEVNMSDTDAITALNNAENFELPQIEGAVTLADLMKQNPQAGVMFLGKDITS